jgi:hypothetical protein
MYCKKEIDDDCETLANEDENGYLFEVYEYENGKYVCEKCFEEKKNDIGLKMCDSCYTLYKEDYCPHECNKEDYYESKKAEYYKDRYKYS